MTRVLAFQLKDVLFQDHPDAAKVVQNDSVTDIINAILPNIYIFASIILFLYLVFGGFLVITAASNPDQAKKGQQAISNAIIGFVIIFASFWIIQAIQIMTGIPILNSGLTF